MITRHQKISFQDPLIVTWRSKYISTVFFPQKHNILSSLLLTKTSSQTNFYNTTQISDIGNILNQPPLICSVNITTVSGSFLSAPATNYIATPTMVHDPNGYIHLSSIDYVANNLHQLSVKFDT